MSNHQKTLGWFGFGRLASKLTPVFVEQGYAVEGFRRSCAEPNDGVAMHCLDVSQAITQKLSFDYIVISLTPDEMSDAGYQRSYVNGLKNILAALDKQRLKKLFWVSSTGVYGQSQGEWVDEHSETLPGRYSGKRLLEAEQLLAPLEDRACIIRFSGIYRGERHRMVDKIYRGELSGNIEEDYYSNRIHIDDCVGVIEHLLALVAEQKPLSPIYLASDCQPSRYSEVCQWLSLQTRRSLDMMGPPVTAPAGNKRCNNQQLLASGYQFRFPSYQQGFLSAIEATLEQ